MRGMCRTQAVDRWTVRLALCVLLSAFAAAPASARKCSVCPPSGEQCSVCPPSGEQCSVCPASGEQSPPTPPEDLPTVAEKTAGFEARAGFFTFYIDPREGKIWLEVPAPAEERGSDFRSPTSGEVARLIYVEGLASGLGSNPVGLDRGQTSDAVLLVVRRVGRRVLFEQPNLRYRALSDDPAGRRATHESCATSVLWAGDAAALDPDGKTLVDFTQFLLRDAHGVVRTLDKEEQGEWQLDEGRSVVDPMGCLAFPDNVELEAILTFAGSKPGDHVKSTAPAAETITLIAHHSLIRLPDDGYRPRRFDPRAGVHAITFADYAVGLAEPIERRWINRHRLEKIDPTAERSKVKEPLVYYLDPGAPEPVRGALLDGARWWAEAFEAAGFIDAFRVELLPADAHPLDVRYNVIQWVHRSTRGWSYGGGVIDPRTGEILKGQVSLGSLRVRQDRLLFEGLAGTAQTGSGAAGDPVQLALARIRQLSAHEVGHTLGLGHNFAASTYGDRASVMDYPAPLIGVTDDGELDFSRAYGVGVGAWDKHAIRYAYAEFPPGADEARELSGVVAEGIAAGLTFLSDDDARPAAAAEPRANLWDNGADPVAALETTLEVRRIALEGFGEHNVANRRPLAELQEVLATVYFHHRYQLDAAAKVVGGMEYNHALRGDGQTATDIVDAGRQRRALEVMLGILAPERLDLPERVLTLLPPRPFESERNREMFASATEPAFDALGAAATAADQVVRALLEPERLARVVDFHRRDRSLPGVGEVFTALLKRAFASPAEGEDPRHGELRQVTRRVVADRWMALAKDPAASPAVRAHAELALRRARSRLPGEVDLAVASPHDLALAGDLDRFFQRSQTVAPAVPVPAELPPGSPIGASNLAACGGR